MILLLLGAPGSGKGTQGRRLSEHFSIPYLASGDLLRVAMQNDTALGRQVTEYMERGLYVPDKIVVPPLIKEFDRLFAESGGAVLDGFPRNREQAEVFDSALTERGTQLDRALLLDVPREVIEPRLVGRRVCRACNASYHVETKPPKVAGVCDRCGGEVVQRVDDRPEMVDSRLRVYFELTWPLVAHYKQKHRLAQIDGNRPESDVTAALIDAARGAAV